MGVGGGSEGGRHTPRHRRLFLTVECVSCRFSVPRRATTTRLQCHTHQGHAGTPQYTPDTTTHTLQKSTLLLKCYYINLLLQNQ